MSRDFFFSCIAIAVIGWTSSRASAEPDSLPAGTKPMGAIGTIHIHAEEIDVDSRLDGTWFLNLRGNANVNTGDMQASGGNVKLSFSAKSRAVLRLSGNVHVRTDAICATARSATIDFASGTWELNSEDGEAATVRTLDAKYESRLEAASIRFNALKSSIEATRPTPIQVPPEPD